MNCPLCEHEEIELLDIINHKLLSKEYKKLTKVDFSYLINKDQEYYKCKQCKLRFFYPIITGDESFYKALQKFDWYYLDEKNEYKEAIKYISLNDKVLDVGSGKGAFSKLLPTKNYIGLDFSKNAKKMAAKDNIVVENEMIQSFANMHPSSFDVVASFQVLEHISEPALFIESKIKALKPGGKLIMSVPSEDSFLKHVNNGILNMPPHHVSRWPDETLMFIADKYDLKLINILHEKVQEIHGAWYLSTLIQSFLVKSKLLNDDFSRKVILKISTLLSRIMASKIKNEMLPNGHSVTVVYEKK